MNGDNEVSSSVVSDSSKQVTSSPPEKQLAPLEDIHTLASQLPLKIFQKLESSYRKRFKSNEGKAIKEEL
ncbi:hypothetical protein Q3G72_034819 [Acer saccharum]|nr:hypothetical protein Q3G72_034819 [Acer saccharum]